MSNLGRIDIWGNDRYLRHVHNSVLGQVEPEATHEVVLGDLFGSQWIPDEEFLQRVHRYKDIIFRDVQLSYPLAQNSPKSLFYAVLLLCLWRGLIVAIARGNRRRGKIHEHHGKPRHGIRRRTK